MRRALITCAVALSMSVLAAAADATPKLVVLLVVDQMRADYVDRFRTDWSAGLRRLVDRGAWFRRAAYPYVNTVTCAGHATIATGTYPHVHGLISNTWFDRGRNAVIPCTDDPRATAIPYGTDATAHTGFGNLQVPTLADQMRGRGSKIVALGLKARSAIMMAGHGGDAVTWASDSMDGWETSTAYAKVPVPQVSAFLTANPMRDDLGKVWDRSLPLSQYSDPDAGLKEDPPKGWTATFPHALTGEGVTSWPDATFYDQWQHSPFADEYTGRMAAALVEAFQLGTHAQPDYLAVSFSSPDLVGHSFGPHSQEIQDMYARLDRTVGTLLDVLDRSVGEGAYVVALSADHGVADIPEQVARAGKDAGRTSASALVNAGNVAARAILGAGNYVLRVTGNEVYFAPGAFERVKAAPKALPSVIDALSRQPGVRRVFAADELLGGSASTDPDLRAAALSYVPGRSGDLVVLLKPNWTFNAAGTTHGSANPDDQRVPIVLYGTGVKPGRYDAPASPADIAPTLGRLVNLTLPKAEGRILNEALR